MTVHVGEVVSEVVAEPGPAPATGTVATGEDPERVRELLARLRRDALRTRAEGFDD
jgi:hypothetical protein